MTTNKEELTRNQEPDDITPLLLGTLKNYLSVISLILQKDSSLGLLTSENAYEVCHRALYRAPEEDKLGLLRILRDTGLLSLLSLLNEPSITFSICYSTLDGMPLKDFSEGLGILDEAGFLSQLPPRNAYHILCNMVLDKVTAEDITAEGITAAADSFKVLIESISLNNLLKLLAKVKGKLQEEPCINQEFYQQCLNMLELEKESVNNLGPNITALFTENSNQEIAEKSRLSRGYAPFSKEYQ